MSVQKTISQEGLVDKMRDYYDEQLTKLHTQMMAMGGMCEKAISEATQALTEGNTELAREVMEGDTRINQQEREIESMCMKLLLHQQPVAGDLRRVSAALKMVTDMERIGDQAADIAENVLQMNEKLPEKFLHICKMAAAAMKMVTDSVNAYVDRDLELARRVIQNDDKVDELFLKVRGEILDAIREDKSRGEEILDLFMIIKYYERIGDHATNIAEWVEYSITGVRSEEN